jgi:hypothetical protein
MLTSDMVAVPNPDDGPGLAKVIATLDFTQLGAKGWNPRTQGARKANWVECMDEAVNAAGISLAVVLSDPPSLMQIVSATSDLCASGDADEAQRLYHAALTAYQTQNTCFFHV